MGVNENNLSNLYNREINSNEHMMLNMWSKVENWIRDFGIVEFELSDDMNMLGDLKCADLVNAIILNVRKCISFAIKVEDHELTIDGIKANVKNMFDHERLKFTFKGREEVFEGR